MRHYLHILVLALLCFYTTGAAAFSSAVAVEMRTALTERTDGESDAGQTGLPSDRAAAIAFQFSEQEEDIDALSGLHTCPVSLWLLSLASPPEHFFSALPDGTDGIRHSSDAYFLLTRRIRI